MKMHPLGKPQPWVIPVTIVCLVFGGVVAGLTSMSDGQTVDTTQMNREQLVTLYTKTVQEMKGLQKENDELRDKVSKFTDEAVNEQKSRTALQQQINEMRILAGSTPVQGPGILITLDDTGNIKNNPVDPNTNMRVVHDVDLGAIVNELRAVRAEAIEINGQRVMAMTAIRCAGPVIQVNETQVAPPFLISAIGPDTLYGAVNMPGGDLEYLRAVGIRVKVEKRTKLLIPASKILRHLEYGKPVLEESTEGAKQ